MRVLGAGGHFWFERGEETRVLHGVVTALRFEEDRRGNNERWLAYRLRLEPRARLMGLRRSSRIFQSKSIDQVIREVLAIHDVPSRWLLSHPLPTRAYCTQYEETDLAFVTRLAAEAGLHFQFEHAKDEAMAAAAAVGRAVDAGVEMATRAAGTSLDGVRDAATGVFGWVGGLREVMVFADSALYYPAVATADGDDWTAQLARLATHGAGTALGGARGAMEQLDPGLGEAGQVGLDLAQSGIRSALGGTGRMLVFRPTTGALEPTHQDVVLALDKKRQLHSLTATYDLYDPARPAAALTSTRRDRGELAEVVGDLFRGEVDPKRLAQQGLELASEIGESAGGEAVAAITGLAGRAVGATADRAELYEHQGRFLHPEWDYERDEPRRMLEASKRRAALATGRGNCPWLCPGHRFRIEGHPLPSLAEEQVAVAIEHEGTSPHLAPNASEHRANYQHRFECVAADVHYVPPLPPRRFVQVCQTATVVGPTDIDTDELGRIVVRFHWDRRSTSHTHTTCRIRTMQGWANGGYGMQFIPRVGAEVVVGFDGGDPDRPIVLGSVYNAVSPPPFPLPKRRAVSGIRTQSTPGGTEGSELSFDDSGGRELLTIQAQRDLHVTARHQRQLTIEGDDRETVRADRHVRVGGAMHLQVDGGREQIVKGQDQCHVEGDASRSTTGSSQERVEGAHGLDVGSAQHTVRGNASVSADGNVIQRVKGSFVRVVGGGEGARSYATRVEGDFKLAATEQGELIAEGGLVLRCGNSSIHLSPDQIYITAPDILLESASSRLQLGRENAVLSSDGQIVLKGEDVVAQSSGATLGLTSEASIEGARVLLNSPAQAEAPAEDRSNEPTVIELTDQRGEPIPNHPFRIIRSDGSEVSGAVDAEGRAEVDLDEDATIIFPGLRNPRGGS